MRRSISLFSFILLGFSCGAQIQTAVQVSVDLSASEGKFTPIYSWFGYDESNYTTTKNGQALLRELHDLSPVPVNIRAHFLLASGDGKPELKWSSTNVYTEDAQGNPVYSWTILDQIFDAYAAAHVRPMVELGFMPKALSSRADPYHIPWPTKPGDVEGWSFPPKDYARWGELVYQVAAHMAQRYGTDVVSSWYWEVWNEPDIFYWHGTQEEYNKLYDFAAAGVKRAIPQARVGGPATTGPVPNGHSAQFLEAFLQHCAKDKSSATGRAIPLDFISFHVKGSPNIVVDHVQMGLNRELDSAATGFDIVRKFPQFEKLPIILSEADPEGCAACSSRKYPHNAYRNGTLYPSYTAVAMKGLFALQDRYQVNLISMLTWAFEFEDQPYFDGFRALSTNGVDKPVINFFRMAGLMTGSRVRVESNGAVPLDDIIKGGVRQQDDVDALATAADHEAAVMLWNYHDNDVPGPSAQIQLTVRDFPSAVHRVLMQHYRIDDTHSNAYTAWKQMGSPQNPAQEQYAQLQASGALQLEESPRWVDLDSGTVKLNFALPRQGVSLVRFSW
ncbi:beta-xylosidase [Alloacidobacterium dinghuense]|uniref:Beta-xylosidase n=1 Tax=Alloacidobacterium dinghuense TaxID=2763107 RepID=A0A7G8BLX1_9BACT|nr:beta-xylosidase [Alloacidobacterium dinghuense]QNI33541.1 beta-xylosidase [Alloacidobacterium dinghuense]